MPKKTSFLLSDGTGNAASRVWRTNVWRFFQSLDLTNGGQVACYDDGVGTSAFKPLAILGGAFGWGLKRNVIDLYLNSSVATTKPSDDIYALGFSRGAFTIRVVMGLVGNQGIVQANPRPNYTVRQGRHTAPTAPSGFTPCGTSRRCSAPSGTRSSRSRTSCAVMHRTARTPISSVGDTGSSAFGTRFPPTAYRSTK